MKRRAIIIEYPVSIDHNLTYRNLHTSTLARAEVFCPDYLQYGHNYTFFLAYVL